MFETSMHCPATRTLGFAAGGITIPFHILRSLHCTLFTYTLFTPHTVLRKEIENVECQVVAYMSRSKNTRTVVNRTEIARKVLLCQYDGVDTPVHGTNS